MRASPARRTFPHQAKSFLKIVDEGRSRVYRSQEDQKGNQKVQPGNYFGSFCFYNLVPKSELRKIFIH